MKIILIVGMTVILSLTACSTSNNQDESTTVIETTKPDSKVIVEEPMKESEAPPLPDDYMLPPTTAPKNTTTETVIIVPYAGGTQPWQKHQPKLTHKQRFAGVLEAHNGVRLKHGLKPLKWSSKLAKYSQEWANQLGKGKQCQIRHRPAPHRFGENLYRTSALKWNNGTSEVMATTIKDVVKSWTDEEPWYDYQRNRCQPGKICGHYTQIVWKSTSEVGCAVKVCADKSQTWVCSYNPVGNYVGMRPY